VRDPPGAKFAGKFKCWLKKSQGTKNANPRRISGSLYDAKQVAKCLTAVRAQDSSVQLMRKPCLGVAEDFPSQAWQMGNGDGSTKAPFIKNLGVNLCLAMQLDTADWSRSGAAAQSEAQALITVQHQPDTCLSCVKSSGANSVCQVGDRPRITRCSGGHESTRLSWEYMTLAPPAHSPGGDGECVWGINMWFFDINPGAPMLNLTVSQCQVACQEEAKCKAYVFKKQGCLGVPTDQCWLKSSDQGQERAETCTCLGIMAPEPPMCATNAVPSAGEQRDLLPSGVRCSSLTKDSCCKKLDGGRGSYHTQPCTPSKSPQFDMETPNVVCMPLSWVVQNDPSNHGSCKDAAGFSYPCRYLKDKFSGLCLQVRSFSFLSASVGCHAFSIRWLCMRFLVL
jgi:hypothetical protein